MRLSAWVYLAQQTFCSFCLLWAVGLAMGRLQAAPWRLTLTAVLLALLSMAGVGLAPVLRLLLMALTTLAPLAAWPDAPRRFRLPMAVLGCSLPLTLTGLMRALSPLPWTIALPSACGLMLLLARREGRAPPLPRCAAVEITWRRRSVCLTALVDTGNLLRDGVTGLPVIVISRRAAARLVHLPPEGTLLPGMRLLPVRTVSGTALMTILRPDQVRIRPYDTWQEAPAVIGLSPGGGGSFQALVPASLLTAAASSVPTAAAFPRRTPSTQPSTGG